MKFAELFCGIGGFRLGLEKCNGLEKAGQMEKCVASFERSGSFQRGCDALPQESSSTFACVWANDNDKYACQIYRKHYGTKELVEGDIRQVNPDDVPSFDLLTAGFPCQSFSLAGKRKGFQDIRGTLFYEVIRIAEAKRPTLLLLENVKGLLSNDNGKTFGTILESLGNIGYWVEWQTLNSKHFGVPQNRERVFIVGHLRGSGSRQVFPVGSDGEDFSDENKPMIIGHRKNYRRNCQVFDPDGITEALDTSGGGGRQRHVAIASAVDCDGYLRSGARPRDENGKPHLLPIGYRRIRRLTPVECERLQGFPDGWTQTGLTKDGSQIEVSDTQRYKLCGNAVSTPVITFLGTKLQESIYEKVLVQ